MGPGARRSRGVCGVLVAGAVLLAACGAGGGTVTGRTAPGPATAAPTGPAEPVDPPPAPVAVVEVTSCEDLVTGLDVPWGLAFLPDGDAVLTLRDRAVVLRHDPTTGTVEEVTGPGADELAATTTPGGEGGLLGVAVAGADDDGVATLVLYRTTADGNEVVRAPLDGTTLGALEVVLDGIPAARNHDGGHVVVDAAGHLWVTTGDAGDPAAAQDPTNLAGKVLRVTLDGAPAPGNPDPASPVWTLGHRNVQGLDVADDGRVLASELGQDRLDELNLLQPGQNHGWPEVEGTGGGPAYVDPLVTWPPAEASPSGLAVTHEGVYLAALRGQRLWRVPLEPDGVGEPHVVLDDLGRLRRVVEAPDGALWVVTGNTDGRGSPRPGDDRVVRVVVEPAR